MNKLRNENGLTLVELLAVFVIVSIVMVFVSSLLIFVQKKYSSQSESAKQLTDVTIAVKAITKDMRMHDIDKENTTSDQIVFKDASAGNEIIYKHNIAEKLIKKNGAAFIYEVEVFEIDIVDDVLTLTVANKKDDGSLEVQEQKGKRIKTEFTIRE